MLNFKLEKAWISMTCSEGLPGEILSKNNIAAWPSFTKMHSRLWTDKIKVDTFGRNAQQNQIEHITAHTPHTKHISGDLVVIEFTANSSVYQSILDSNVRPFVCNYRPKYNTLRQETN